MGRSGKMTNTVLRNVGFKILIDNLGNVDAEKFIALLLKEPFDYTEWQKDLMEDMSISEISEIAMKQF
jgi:hypothetical protein